MGIGNTNNCWEDLNENSTEDRFCVRSKYSLDACGKPQYNVLPVNVQAPATPQVPTIGNALRNHERRIVYVEKQLVWESLDEPDEGEQQDA